MSSIRKDLGNVPFHLQIGREERSFSPPASLFSAERSRSGRVAVPAPYSSAHWRRIGLRKMIIKSTRRGDIPSNTFRDQLQRGKNAQRSSAEKPEKRNKCSVFTPSRQKRRTLQKEKLDKESLQNKIKKIMITAG
ncbi:hypothetical protein H6P81_017286 [Aristolochia fimbriata]|uniref:Uncharacterized protein n=1 Tax=Aristolochia fimbriata TaxID=158543 RepID=A0AAV7E218_ARIFI|nr:hypothetical protein H6P81_017286 [Aristolochia fimbriata]